jgi:hypothetical protein
MKVLSMEKSFRNIEPEIDPITLYFLHIIFRYEDYNPEAK